MTFEESSQERYRVGDVVRWRTRPGGSWTYGRWSGERGADGSLTVWQYGSLTDAREGGRRDGRRGGSWRSRALRPELVDILTSGPRGGDVWSSAISTAELIERVGVIVPSVPSARTADELVAAIEDEEAAYAEAAAMWAGRREDIEAEDWARSLPKRWPAGVVDPLAFTLRSLAAYASVITWSGWTGPVRERASGSTLVAALEYVYNSVRAEFPKPDGLPGDSELPDAVIITGSGADGYGLKWGHFAHDRWQDDVAHGRRPELFVGGERLATGARLTVQTLLHECAHALAVARGVKDTSRGYRYHNKLFVALAEELGLTYTHDGPDSSIGFSAVTLTEVGAKRWRDQIERLHDALTLHLDDPTALLVGLPIGPNGSGGRGGHGVNIRRPKGTGGSSYVRAQCECPAPRIIRVSATTLALGAITCGQCGSEFLPT